MQNLTLEPKKFLIQKAPIISIEPTMTISDASLHEFILMEIKEKTLAFSKSNSKERKKETTDLENKLNDLVNSDDPESEAQIIQVEEELSLRENEFLATKLQFKENFTILEDEKPSKKFLNLESNKGG